MCKRFNRMNVLKKGVTNKLFVVLKGVKQGKSKVT